MNARAFAVLAVSVMLVASCSAMLASEDDREPDGFPPVIVAIIVAGAVGGAAGWFLNDVLDSDTDSTQEYLRLASANNVSDVVSVASVFTANSNANYAQIWGMTKEHWVRQAEVEAYSQWDSSKDYDSDSILEGADIYRNNAVMSANAVAQIGSLFDELSAKMDAWQDEDTYAGKMRAGFVLDNTRLVSSSLDAKLMSVVDGTGRVYIGAVDDSYIVTSDSYTPAYIYNFGQPTVIESDDGLTYRIGSGLTYLEDIYSQEGHRRLAQGVYNVSGARLGSDSFSAVSDNSLPLRASLLIEYGDSTASVVLKDGKASFGNRLYNGFSFMVEADSIPDGEVQPDAVDMMPVLEAYQRLLDKLYWTTVSANNAAGAVWGIYDRADDRQYGVTTLMASNVYDSVVLSEAMNEVMTLSAMQQLAVYYDIHGDDLGGLQIGLYSDGMDAPFVRGSIIDRYGNPVYEDVVFTPFFQSDDVTLERGTEYAIRQNTFVAVWHAGMELNAWHDSGMETTDYETLFLEQGYSLRITQLAVCDSDGMHNLPSIEFEVTKVRYIEPGRADLSDDISFQTMAKSVLQTVCIVAGILLAASGVLRGDRWSVVLGIVLLVFGIVLADQVWHWITHLRAW